MNLSNKIKKFMLNARLESIAWALFLIMIGFFWLYPEGTFPKDAWLLGTGVILLGLNIVRSSLDIHISSFTVILGIIALIAGLDDFIGFEIPIVPILIIIFGISILIGPSIIKHNCKKNSFFSCKSSYEKWFD
ncbi:hypothetical protein JW758_00205 [Candidatus Peregrinibacteria bacterium]|nr:hypothetical protein [Candidatus Peregrinibacteria bacterium]